MVVVVSPEEITTLILSSAVADEPAAGDCDITTPFGLKSSCVTKLTFLKPIFSRKALAPSCLRPVTSGTSIFTTSFW